MAFMVNPSNSGGDLARCVSEPRLGFGKPIFTPTRAIFLPWTPLMPMGPDFLWALSMAASRLAYLRCRALGMGLGLRSGPWLRILTYDLGRVIGDGLSLGRTAGMIFLVGRGGFRQWSPPGEFSLGESTEE